MTTVTLPHPSVQAEEPLLKVQRQLQPLPKPAIICPPAKESNLGQTEVFTTFSLDSPAVFPQPKLLNFHLFARISIGSLGKLLRQIAMGFFANQE